MIRSNAFVGNIGAMMALSSLALAGAASAVPDADEPGPIYLQAGGGFGGSGPIHRRGRFKRNQRLQRKEGRRK